MNSVPHIALDQWRALIAVVDAGGYAQAAVRLHKSQSAVTYAVQKIESVLGVEVFGIQGRKAVLTGTGQMLYRRALALVAEAADLEQMARKLSAGWEPEIGLAVEILFPPPVLLSCLARFGQEAPRTRVEVIESVLGGTGEALLTGRADLAVTPHVPPGFLGQPLMRQRLLAVAHPDHPLHARGRTLTERDLRAHRHLVVRETSSTRSSRSQSVEVDQRWTFSSLFMSIAAAVAGHGFAWYPEALIVAHLAEGRLKALPLDGAERRFVEMYMVLADPDGAGPGVLRLADIIRETVAGADIP
ncbi:LysR family transcriptional regulator [Zoogloea sp.]|uniref:LysR family transcriptional regulator n=1 Tax=Zoogloea sp. TaxID=49181 RepID=UPI0026032E39|nr:LysR family transcriptional regulator [Zoogloea sp.]MDD3353537.1 LysR family transcriptional regulator [Zoogloea sp.]